MAIIGSNGGLSSFSSVNLLSPLSSPGEYEYKRACDFKKVEDLPQAFLNYQSAAEKGHAEAQYHLASCYERGEGTDKDEKKAIDWYEKAAHQNHLVAKGIRYLKGYSVTKDEIEAFKCFNEAADKGFVAAQFALGLCYANGQGVTQNHKEAVSWYRKAAEQGDAKAQYSLGVSYANGQGVTQDLKEAVFVP
jgi:TPR repeat protein